MISVVAVNYNSSDLLKACLASVVSTAGDIPLEIIVVDSGSTGKEVDRLSDLPVDAELILNRENIGYARAVNMGVRKSRGDVILITNPDVLYMPGSIQGMLKALQELPRCGAVEPRSWWDEGMTFLLPPSEFITPYRSLKEVVMRASPSVHDAGLRRWLRRALRYWLSEGPCKREMLSGACIMTTRKVMDVTGGFDEAFPLYFEDADWCLRVRRKGYLLYMVPDADVVHYYNQSAKQLEDPDEKFRYSLNLFFRKHFRGRLYLYIQARRFINGRRNRTGGMYDDLGVLSEPPLLELGGDAGKLLLLSPVDTLIPSAAAFFEGDRLEVPGQLWALLSEGRYFARAFTIDLKCHRSWSWIKGRG